MFRTLLGRLRRRPVDRPRCKNFTVDALDGLERREVPAVILPPGFTESVVTTGLNQPQTMAIAPDGRIFIAQTPGTIAVVKNGQLLAQPFANVFAGVPIAGNLQALAFDPRFNQNHYVYAYMLSDAGNGWKYNQLMRFTANGDVAVPGSGKVLLTLPPFHVTPADVPHDGATIKFGRDGKLYISTGDLSQPSLSQQINNPYGKMLRINADGSIPRDNPFYRATTGVNRAIWATGLRNPFTFDVQPTTGLMYINDVGSDLWEEINVGARGANYGWPQAEGPNYSPGFSSPIFAYPHSSQPNTQSVAITGGAFYNPAHASFPRSFVGTYFFEDFGNGWISRLDARSGKVVSFAAGLPEGLNDLDVDPAGNLYFLDFQDGSLLKISYNGPTASPLARR